jgi:hypothetical protein
MVSKRKTHHIVTSGAASVGWLWREAKAEFSILRDQEAKKIIDDGTYSVETIYPDPFVEKLHVVLSPPYNDQERYNLALDFSPDLRYALRDLMSAIGKTVLVEDGKMVVGVGMSYHISSDDTPFQLHDIFDGRVGLLRLLGLERLAALDTNTQYKILGVGAEVRRDKNGGAGEVAITVYLDARPKDAPEGFGTEATTLRFYFERDWIPEVLRVQSFFERRVGRSFVPRETLPTMIKSSMVNDIFNVVADTEPLLKRGEHYVLDSVTTTKGNVVLDYHRLADHHMFVKEEGAKALERRAKIKALEGMDNDQLLSSALSIRRDLLSDQEKRLDALFEADRHRRLLFLKTYPAEVDFGDAAGRRARELCEYFGAKVENYQDRNEITVFSVSDDVHDGSLDYMKVPPNVTQRGFTPRFDFVKVKQEDVLPDGSLKAGAVGDSIDFIK